MRKALEQACAQLDKAADQFAFYADEHAKKGTKDGDAKGMLNHQWALACARVSNEARTTLAPPDSDVVERAWAEGELAGRQSLAHSLMAAERAAAGQKARAEKAEALADKYKWQVIDTCRRAELAEAKLSTLEASTARPEVGDTRGDEDRNIGDELREAANLLDASGDYDLRDACREAACRFGLSQPPATSDGSERRAKTTIGRAFGLIAYITGLPEHLRWTPEFTRYVSEEADQIASLTQHSGEGK